MIQEILPKSKFLKKYIQSFSILVSDGKKDINYYLFPQIGSTLVLTNNTYTKRFDNKIQFINDINSSPTAEIFGKYTSPVLIQYKGVFNEFSVDFTAAGINYFFDKPYNLIASNNFQELKNSSLAELSSQISIIIDSDQKVEIAEQYFIKKFNQIKIGYLEKAVSLILNQGNISIDSVAQECNVSTRTLNRVFNNYIGCSPQIFKKIVRFRKAINYKLRSEEKLIYTDLFYDDNFYDSSHFIREFKSLTNENPTNFFNTISEMGISKFPVRFS